MTEWNLIPRTLQFLSRWMTPRTVWRLAFASIIFVEVAMLLWVGRKQWYFFDEWRLVIERVVPHPDGPLAQLRLLFRPDGEHVIGIPLAIFVVIVRWFGVDSYWPFVFVNVIIRVATLFVLDDVCRRVGARRMVRLLAVATIALFGEGYESLFGQSIIFAGFTLIACLLAIRVSLKPDISERRAAIGSAAWLSVSILSSSYGFPVVAGLALYYLLIGRRRASLTTLIVPPVVFIVVRMLAGGSYAQQQPLSSSRLPLYIHYVQRGLSAVGESILGMDGLGIASFVVIALASLWLATEPRQRAFVVSILAMIVLFYLEASLSRSVFGPEQARAAGRYTFFCGVLAVAMLAAAWGQRRLEPRWAPLAAALVVVSLANSIGWLGDGSAYYTDKMQVSRDRLALGFNIVERGLAVYVPDPAWAGDMTGPGLKAVLGSKYDDEFTAKSASCFRHWDEQIVNAGVDEQSLTKSQHAALLVLLSEHAMGVGDAGASLGQLVQLGAQVTENPNGVIVQFQQDYVALAGTAIGTSDVVPSMVTCSDT
jgi:hypothetical protein